MPSCGSYRRGLGRVGPAPGRTTITHWTQCTSKIQPGINMLDSGMDEQSMLYRMGYSMNEVAVF